METGKGRTRYGRVAIVVLLVIVLLLLVVSAASAAPKTTLPTRSTWDEDMINSDITGYAGAGVYVAVLDTGLAPNWKDYFPVGRIASGLGMGFRGNLETGAVGQVSWIGDVNETHGTHVTSTILGYNYYSPADAAEFPKLTPVFVNGAAPGVTIVPVKVLSSYTIAGSQVIGGTAQAIAAGIRYATDLKIKGYSPMIITMSLGGPNPIQVEEDAIDYAISHGVIVVASAGNSGDMGMDWPGAYPQVISVGACGWKDEWYGPNLFAPPPVYDLWWLQDNTYGYNDVPEKASKLASQVYIAPWSSRQEAGQQLDVVAPGSWVRGPYPGWPGYAHLPWWSEGQGSLKGKNPGNFYFVGGTSMAVPHVTGIAAQMLQKNPTLNQTKVESTLKQTALSIPPGSMTIFDFNPSGGWYTYSWAGNATGVGLVQADRALAAVTVK